MLCAHSMEENSSLSDEHKQLFAEFDVIHVEGDPIVWDDWLRVGVEFAYRIVILANPHEAPIHNVDGAAYFQLCIRDAEFFSQNMLTPMLF